MEKKQLKPGIWKKSVTKKDGSQVEALTFTLEGKRYTAWPNNSDNPNAPAYSIMEDTYKPKENTGYKAPVKQDNDDLPF